MSTHPRRLHRRDFLARSIAAGSLAGAAAWTRCCRAEGPAAVLEAGEGTVDTTPPLGIEMAGFHRAPGNERRIAGIRQPTAARALVLKQGDTLAAIVSLDILGVSNAFARRVQQGAAQATGVPAENVRVCSIHTHSMPTFRFCRQWGAIPEDYMAQVERKAVEAIVLAKADLAPAEVLLGRQRVVGGNFNRPTSTWKTDEQFGRESTDADRWLDTMLHVLRFRRGGAKPELLWYHFSAHAVCYTDNQAGPDWPGLVASTVRQRLGLTPSYLQGHAGDVNPGPGKPWLGVPEEVAQAVCAGLEKAYQAAAPVAADTLRVRATTVDLPLDLALMQAQLEQYRQDPAKCTGGPWVDAPFAADWAQSAARWNPRQTTLQVPLSAMRLGSVGLLFHPAELYSFYGLAIRRDSPMEHTLVVGYADDTIGYLPDPNASKAGEYAATTVPKILDLPPYTPGAAARLAQAAVGLLSEVAG